MAKTLVRQGHTVLAYSRGDYSTVAKTLGVSFFSDADDLCEQHPEVILMSTSIFSTKQVLRSLPLSRLKRSTLFVDVLSVKEFPRDLFLQALPNEFDILCTHPMFGPESGKNGWNCLPFVYDMVRIGEEESRVSRCDKFLDVFRKEGCKMVEMSCEKHDQHAAGSQFITHTVGRILQKLGLKETPINTKGYDELLNLVKNTASDSFDLYNGLFLYNKNSMEQLALLNKAIRSVKNELFGHMSDLLRKQQLGQFVEGLSNVPLNGAGLPPPFEIVKDKNYSFSSPPPHLRQHNDAQISNVFDKFAKLKIAIIGFGNFGQFLAKTLVRQQHTILAYSRSDRSADAQSLGVSFFHDLDDLCEQHPDVVLFSTSITSTEEVLCSFPFKRLKRNTLFVDVLSVKEFPRNLFLQNLPKGFDILSTHPMFGPESGKSGWDGLLFVYEKVRIGEEESRVSRCNRFLDIFKSEKCKMVEMSCAEHDLHAAGSQFITHTVGRILKKLGLEATPIDTKGYETLLNLVENTGSDSFDLFYGLFMYNKNSMEQLELLHKAFESLEMELCGRLHNVSRQKVFGKSEEAYEVLEERRGLLKLSQNGAA